MKNIKYKIFLLVMSACCIKNASAAQPQPQVPHNQGQPNFELLKQKSALDVFKDNKTRFSHLVQQNPQAALSWMASQVSSNPQSEQKLKMRVDKYGLIGQAVAQVGSAGFSQLSEQERQKLARVMGYKDFYHIYTDGALKDPLIIKQLTPLLHQHNYYIKDDLDKELKDKYEIDRARGQGENDEEAKTRIVLKHIQRQTSWHQTFDDQISRVVARNKPQELNQLIINLGHNLTFDDKSLKTNKAKTDLADFAVRHIDRIELKTLTSVVFLPQFRTRYATHLVENSGAPIAPEGPLKISQVDPENLARLIYLRGDSKKASDQLARLCIQHFDQLPKATQNKLRHSAGTKFDEMYFEHKLTQNDPSWINNMDDAELEGIIDPVHKCLGGEEEQAKIAGYCFKHRDKLKPEIVAFARKENKYFRELEQKAK